MINWLIKKLEDEIDEVDCKLKLVRANILEKENK